MNRRNSIWLPLLVASLVVVTLGCLSTAQDDKAATTQPAGMEQGALAEVDHAVAVLRPTEGNNAQGVVHFYEENGRVRVVADVQGLEPNGRHGFHVHEFGDISAPDATSAGGHYDPQHTHHHALPGEEHTRNHAGDMGNLEADGEGKAHYEQTFDSFSLAGKSPVLGRAVIVHAKPDDGGQPTGNAGDRIAAGVIGVAKSDSQ